MASSAPGGSAAHAADPWALGVEPGVVLLILGLAAGYAWMVHRWGATHAPDPDRPVSRRQVLWFGLGLASMWMALGWPLHQLGEGYLFSAHMLQHLILGFLAAPLLLLGTPGWMLRAVIGRGSAFAVVRQLCRPVPAFIVFNAALVVLHWPAAVEVMLEADLMHGGLHVVMLGAGLVMWMPLVSPMPEIPRLAPPANLLYLFLQSIVPTVPASFLTFGETVLYKDYESVPRLWDISVLTDQRVSGLLMKVGAGFLLWAMIAVLFFGWQAEEERRSRRPVEVDPDELELELLA